MNNAHRIGFLDRMVRRCLVLPASPTGKLKTRRLSKLGFLKFFIYNQLADTIWHAKIYFQQLREQACYGSTARARSYTQFQRALRASQRTVLYEIASGKQLQHDWGETRTEVAGRVGTANINVNILGYSRYLPVWTSPNQDAKNIVRSLVGAFEYFDSVLVGSLVNNQKDFETNRNCNGKVILNTKFLELVNHYEFDVKFRQSQRLKTKEKTTRIVSYVNYHIFQQYRGFDSYAYMKKLLKHWLNSDARKQTPVERFHNEHPQFQAKPDEGFDSRYQKVRQVTATAILDLLLHHSTVLNIKDENYKSQDKPKAGLISTTKKITEGYNNTEIKNRTLNLMRTG